jgi:signal transduction histidine kinase
MTTQISSVLVLDDETNVRRALGRLDLGPGIAVHLCATAAEAHTALALEPIDVVLVDQHLGPGDPAGLEVLAGIRESDPDCFRIIFTGGADLEFAVQAINRGHIDAFLTKPWDDSQVVALLHQGAETALLRRHNRALLGELAQRNADLLAFSTNLENLVEERTSHLRQAREELREAHERLQQQQQALVRLETHGVVNFLARGMAHELNNPLAAILGYAQRLRRGSADADTQRRLDVILTEVERCRQLVEQLRRMAAPLDEEPVACDPAEALAAAERRRREAGRPVPELSTAPRLPRVLAAPRALARVLDEVLGNAMDFGATRCELTAESRLGRARLHLANNGATPGEAEAANATKPFFTTRAAAGNRGLGLAIAAGLLRDQEGHLELSPRSGGGAVATIQLPLAPGSGTESGLRPVAADQPGTAVLVVDDEPMLVELLTESLRERGFDVHRAGSVADALAQLGARAWGAVVADYRLPDGTGLELIQRAQRQAPTLAGHCALMTGDSQALAETSGRLPVLAKPFRIDQLAELVERLVRG